MTPLKLQPHQGAADVQRNLVMFLIDCSGSMNELEGSSATRRRIDAASELLSRALMVELPRIGPFRARGEIAIGAFNGASSAPSLRWAALGGDGSLSADLEQPFVLLREVAASPKLEAQSQTPLADAVIWGGEAMLQRIEELPRKKLSLQYKPTIFLITDGKPSTGQDLRKAEAFLANYAFGPEYRFFFIAIGARGADEATLKKLAPVSGAYVAMQGAKIDEILKLVTMTLHAVSDEATATPSGPATTQADYSRFKKMQAIFEEAQ